jgi:pyruvate,orthophosphate dikinase
MTSHAAVVARGMGTCCISGLGEITFSEDRKSFTLGGITFREGDLISLDGSTGKVYRGMIKTVPASISGDFERLMVWADKFRTMKVRANADTPSDARQARSFGAEGIGLCRTEHMFFLPERISAIRKMIVSDTYEQRWDALSTILPMQRDDFEQLFESMEGSPVTIRLLDPPLHEFLPSLPHEIDALAKEMNIPSAQLRTKIDSLHEFNPMMGHRGVRLDVTYPEIGEMQTRAIIEAALAVSQKHPDWTIVPEIMVPLIGSHQELMFVRNIISKVADDLIAAAGVPLDYKIGTMIEIPRAALRADVIAEEADFFSFGTNDLTQMVFGFSRDDAASFLPAYYRNNIYENDPFQKIDRRGVGKLIRQALESARETKPELKCGVCGEHGGDPISIEFFYGIGIDYVSCSPYRVPIARLAAAQAALRAKRE